MKMILHLLPSGFPICCAVWLALAVVGLPGCGKVGSDRHERRVFLAAFEDAHQRGEAAAMLDLYALEGVDDEVVRVLRFSVATEIDWPVRRVRFIGLDPGESYVFESDGVWFEPSLQPVDRIHVEYDLPQRVNSTFLVGRDAEGRYRLVAPQATASTPGGS